MLFECALFSVFFVSLNFEAISNASVKIIVKMWSISCNFKLEIHLHNNLQFKSVIVFNE